MATLMYDGRKLNWIENGEIKHCFAATSGLSEEVSGTRNYQHSKFQCCPNVGPIPEGTYVLRLEFNRQPVAQVADPETCRLQAATGIEQIPDADPEQGTEHCTPYWQNWGYNRVRIDAYDTKAKQACGGHRSGFYIHDSHKGYTHGCIEAQHEFFNHLYDFVNSNPKKKLMLLGVDYGKGSVTRGKTKRPR